MLQPARTKYRKKQKGRNRGMASRSNKVSFGEYGLKAIGHGRLTARQIEAARRAHVPPRQAWRQALDPRIPGQADIAKPAEVRMGNGKGNREFGSPKSSLARSCSRSKA